MTLSNFSGASIVITTLAIIVVFIVTMSLAIKVGLFYCMSNDLWFGVSSLGELSSSIYVITWETLRFTILPKRNRTSLHPKGDIE